MLSKPDQVVVTPRGTSDPRGLHGGRPPSRFPEVRGEGHSPEDAAARPAYLPARGMGSSPRDRRREGLQQTIDDVRALVTRPSVKPTVI